MNWYRCALRRVGLPISGWTLALAGLACALAAPRALASDGRLRGVSDCNGNGVADASDLGVWTPRVNVSAADGAADDLFGAALALDGDTMVVGALDDDDAGFSAGSAYVYVRSGLGWVQQAKLIASDAAAGDLFGWSVSVHGDTAIVGAPFANLPGAADAGAAYVFVRSGGVWAQEAKLTAWGAAPGDQFGVSVSISGNSVLVGARFDDVTRGVDAGSAYVFARSGGVWSPQVKLEASDGAATDLFGFSVAIHQDIAIVGTPNHDHAGGAEAGAAYVFVRGGSGIWSQQAKLTASDAAAGDGFGSTVAVHNQTAVVGAQGDTHAGGDSAGSAYVFVRSVSWSQQAKLIASDAGANDWFGYSVAIQGNLAVVGSIFDDHAGGIDAGSAYVFDRSSGFWTEAGKLTAPGAAANDGMGTIVAISGDTVLAGVYRDDHAGGANAGSVQTFALGRDCDGDTVPDECALVADADLDCNDDGVLDACQIDAWAEHAKLTVQDSALGDWFGFSVAVQGDTGLIAAVNDNQRGSAYVFARSEGVWSPQAVLAVPSAEAGADLGHSVSLFGDTAILGAPHDSHSGFSLEGSAYVFTRSVGLWTQQARLVADDAQDGDGFGVGVSISGDTVVVGAYGDSHDFPSAVSNAGSAYVFVRSGDVWQQEARLFAADAAADDLFGWNVAIDGNTAVVSADLADHAGHSNAGAVYIFIRSGGAWTQQAKLTASDPAPSDRFGDSVSIAGDTVIVGATGDDHGGDDDAGSAYIFVRSGGVWTQQAKLVASDSEAIDRFGFSVSLAGDVAVVGAFGDHYAGFDDAGSAYVFRRVGGIWSQESKLTPADPGRSDLFGSSVCTDGETAIIGAFLDDEALDSNVGSAYAFTIRRDCDDDGILDECEADCDGNGTPDDCQDFDDCNNNGIPDECDIAAQTSGDCDEDGTLDECEPDCDGDEVPDDCQDFNDCNNNGIPDQCDIAAQTSSDCNSNGVPDECDVPQSGIAKLTASDAAAGDQFGDEVSISGDRAVIGADGDDDGGSSSGSAYVYHRTGGVWQQVAKLTAADAAATDLFGVSVSISGDKAVIGAEGNDDGGINAGSAYVFREVGGVWQQIAKLTAADPATLASFGRAVSINGNTAIIGATGDDDAGSSTGSAYVFREVGGVWQQIAKLTAADAAQGDQFGQGVAISGNTAVIGAVGDDDGGSLSGSAYVFREVGGAWQQIAKLTAADAELADSFGRSVSISGDTALIGASLDDDDGSSSGSAYIFREVGGVWQQIAKLTAADAAADDLFGTSVSLSGDTAVIGAVSNDDGGTDTGSAYVFREIGGVWQQVVKLTAADAAAGDWFGSGVAINGSSVVIGARDDDDGGSNSGSVYIFALIPDSNGNGVPDECELGACCFATGTCELKLVETCSDFVCDVFDHQPATFTGCFADADGNGVVNAADRGAISANLGQTANALLCIYDLDGNGVVNAADRGVVSANINLCVALPDYQNGSGMNGGAPDTRFGAAVFMGSGTVCAEVACP